MEETKERNPRDELNKNQCSLLERIEYLASVYNPDARGIAKSAWQCWFDAVKGFTLSEISEAISYWSKTGTRMMTPADLYKLLQAKRSDRREAAVVKEQETYKERMPPEVAKVWVDGMKAALQRDIPSDAWARRLKIKEAYGFAMTEFCKKSWRKALNFPDSYHFEDTNGVFPLDDYPDERTSLYHDSHLHFVREYEERHGFSLVYDKELATKRYPTEPLRYNGRGEPVREAA